jgi:hypothetical protein
LILSGGVDTWQAKQDIAVFIAERDGDLPCMLVDAQIEHHGGSPVGRWVKKVDTLPYPMGEPLLLKEVALSQIPESATLRREVTSMCRTGAGWSI